MNININIIFIKGTVLTSILIILAYTVLMKYVNFSVVFYRFEKYEHYIGFIIELPSFYWAYSCKKSFSDPFSLNCA